MRKKKYRHPDPTLANNLKDLLFSLNLSEKEFGNVINRDGRTVYDWITAATSPSCYDMKNICEAFKVSADELLGLRK